MKPETETYRALQKRIVNEDDQAKLLAEEHGWHELASRNYWAARSYLRRGFSILPQLPGEKKPPVRWKEFQGRLPTMSELAGWYRQWPEAGMCVALGPVSSLFVIDVDGEEAHQSLLEHLGKEPVAPKVLSGSGKPYRYHLFFAHPPMRTRAKATPWHEQLEFRGRGGMVVLPPSLHKSGRRYRWAPGQGLDDLDLPPVPEMILYALPPTPAASVRRDPEADPDVMPVKTFPMLSRNTRLFLAGAYAHKGMWNSRLFNAACDMAGNGIPEERAMLLLLKGAQPWTDEDDAAAVRTIESAYSQDRKPARVLAAERKTSVKGFTITVPKRKKA